MLYESLKKDMLSARKNKESEKVVWFSSLIGELQRTGAKEFEDAQVITLIKKNIESLKENLKGGSGHEAIQREIEFLSAYLPQQMSEAELKAAVEALVAGGATQMKAVMMGLQSQYGGRYDGKVASGIVKEALSKLA
ncbi:hypothetical protein COW36_15990 [bacterium (Candidatus Blackallbacteria) CG17_big_fil_post_rev_8_21_14_2_50_48_46]|uniref:Glutamyl-tRNA amidotransferase n=1 Tax=bacterium (Candidatus Blackallbacteria) CG17_big_fil_post_rev_8_21_14_2_50_48_46 TaxID=2014261 RepID=A0A2M7G1Y2_9BACT|nr:MAG: hypothetical protein COW64_09140 [bacterium (Candidatus Blackallbacteria) CG18_big_fil_WC_8_21_14_2_50_49_26]PIW15769.1 MAG: hypothetical protein COW36_15990 [bacterium (Candidatus Blackallbacteria) CG17_big_fil_post_rev_8_21_14_2_50_48_46]PIW48733.1 MAG: hypothetical protein COW20_08265 [bacterium (Candidatus Blackallbacteria) CG13_big_fil_rev_8_21_14_2_50_49_14]